MGRALLTAFRPANLPHAFWSTFDVDASPRSAVLAHDHAGTAKLRYKLERFKHTELDRIYLLVLATGLLELV